MTYRELPAEFPAGEDAPEEVTVLLGGDPLTLTDPGDRADDEPTRDDDPTASGLWLGEWDGRPVSVRLAWTDRLVSHASARVGTDEELVVLELTGDDPPTVQPVEGRYDFTVELRTDES